MRIRVECKFIHIDLYLQPFLGHLKFLTYLVMLFLELLSTTRHWRFSATIQVPELDCKYIPQEIHRKGQYLRKFLRKRLLGLLFLLEHIIIALCLRWERIVLGGIEHNMLPILMHQELSHVLRERACRCAMPDAMMR